MPSQFDAPPSNHPLKPFVLGVFHNEQPVDFRSEWILPKVNVDVLVNLGPPIRAIGKRFDRSLGTHDVLVAGMHTSAFEARPSTRLSLIGMSLPAEACAAIFRVPPGELRDRYVQGAMIDPDLPELGARVAEAPDFAARVALFLSWLEARLAPSRKSEMVRRSGEILNKRPSETAVSELAKAHGVSSRHLHRVFTECVGVGPAHYARLARLKHAMTLMARLERLTDVAHAAAYTDQAHFCHEFMAIANMTPAEYRRGAGTLAGHTFVR